jgi:hypothetical protein
MSPSQPGALKSHVNPPSITMGCERPAMGLPSPSAVSAQPATAANADKHNPNPPTPFA